MMSLSLQTPNPKSYEREEQEQTTWPSQPAPSFNNRSNHDFNFTFLVTYCNFTPCLSKINLPLPGKDLKILLRAL